MTKLTAKQARFVAEYPIDLHGTKAAIRAGYKATNARQVASDMLADPKIMAAIDDAMSERIERTKIDADWVLQRLADEADADLADLNDDKGELLPVEDWPLIWRQGLVTGIDSEELYAGEGEDRKLIGYARKVKLADRTRRLELIGKHVRVNAFQEVVELKGLNSLADRIERAHKRAAQNVAAPDESAPDDE